jgi:hypothetical protein
MAKKARKTSEVSSQAAPDVAPDVAGLFRRAAHASAQSLGRSREGIASAIDSLRQGRSVQGLGLLQPILDEIGRVVADVKTVRETQTGLGEPPGEWDDLERDLAGAAGFLRPLREAATRRDWVELSDLMTYEMAPALERWQGRLEALAR